MTCSATKELRVYVALAIALGGDDDLVRRGMVTFEPKSRADQRWDMDINSLRNLYLDTFDSRGLSGDDLDSGQLYRFVRNAEVMRRSAQAATSTTRKNVTTAAGTTARRCTEEA